MRCSGRDKYGIARTLHDRVSFHVVLLQEPLSQICVQVPLLVMNGIMIGFDTDTSFHLNFVQQGTDLVGVLGVVDVPQCPREICLISDALSGENITFVGIDCIENFLNVFSPFHILGYGRIDHYIHSIRNIQMKIGGSLCWVQSRTICAVHFWSQIRTYKEATQPTRQV
ncbi:AAEL007163-PA [Aedes aegypti]|uniref:AAEL007163-PA n=1 Tax=Aedes aegypti TaxID=7159 RepID=Q173F7_AEDAE|nr:AAEL007163-PA [Aedes aegypti]